MGDAEAFRDFLSLLPHARRLTPLLDELDGQGRQKRRASGMCMLYVSKPREHVGNAEMDVNLSPKDTVSYAGLQLCDSPCCPCCGARISRDQMATVQGMIARRIAAGWRVVLALGTVPHRRGEPLAVIRERLVRIGEAALAKLKRWSRKALGEALSYIIGEEATYHWTNSWHPHWHALLAIPPGLSAEAVDQVRAAWAECWIWAAAKYGITVNPSAIQAEEARDAEAAAEYVTKGTLPKAVAEVTSPSTKQARREDGATPLQMLREIKALRDKRAAAADGRGLDRTEYRRLATLEELYQEWLEVYLVGGVRRIRSTRDLALSHAGKEAPPEDQAEEEATPKVRSLLHVASDGLAQFNAGGGDLAVLRDKIQRGDKSRRFTRAWEYLVGVGVHPGQIRPGVAAPADDRPAGYTRSAWQPGAWTPARCAAYRALGQVGRPMLTQWIEAERQQGYANRDELPQWFTDLCRQAAA